MKKYRLTKITVKIREIISMSKESANEIQHSVCPVCHAPLSTTFPTAENSAIAVKSEEQTGDYLPAKFSGKRD